MTPPDKPLNGNQSKRTWIVAGAVLGMLLLAWLFGPLGSAGPERGAIFVARRGPLEISVLEGGSIQALEYQEIKCEVRVGYQGTKILRIVEEGYQITPEDLKNGKVLVELDSSEIEKGLMQQKIQYESAKASLTDAQKSYEIQINQNISDIKNSEQKARAARMKFEEYLGDKLAAEILGKVGLDETAVVAEVLATAPAEPFVVQPDPSLVPEQTGPEVRPAVDVRPEIATLGKPPAEVLPGPASEVAGIESVFRESLQSYTNALAQSVLIEFAPYARLEALEDGGAKQKLRTLEDNLMMAKKQLGQADTDLQGTRRLFDKGFVTRTELERDEINHDSAMLKLRTAETERDLFLKYEFSLAADEALSRYAETVRELERAGKAAASKLAQSEARLRSAQAQFSVQSRNLDDLEKQMEKCIIRAEKTGLVVYGGNRDSMAYYGGQEQIREGATVRERQAIITIPDMTRMGVNVKIHESYIKKIKKGQQARITLDAFPDSVLEGEVITVGVLPDSQNRWMNPDIKVYLTTIRVNGSHDWLKPGMSAKVQIFVDHLQDVVHVPNQCVRPENGKRFCYLSGRGQPEAREVETGQFNDEFIEIKSGLVEGDPVMLNPPVNDLGEQDFAEPVAQPAVNGTASAATPPSS